MESKCFKKMEALKATMTKHKTILILLLTLFLKDIHSLLLYFSFNATTTSASNEWLVGS
jgi:hypothetical protein